MSVHFHNLHPRFKLKQRRTYKKWIDQIVAQENHTLGSINYIFLTDGELLKMNQEYLEHDTYTDIITFDLSEIENSIDGDIYISVDRVRENANQLEVAMELELKRVMAHGILHLVGYDDKKEEDRTLMRKKENKYLELFP